MDDLKALADQHLAQARTSEHGRSAHTFLHEGPLRQSVIALTAGSRLDEHTAPPAASLQVLDGRVTLTTESGDRELSAGQIHPIPQERHGLTALDDSVVMLTTVTGID